MAALFNIEHLSGTLKLLFILLLASFIGTPSAQASDFSAIDQHALNVPSSAETSITTLATYLTATASNDTEKARAIFRWITQNIAYDVNGYFNGASADTDPNSILKRRIGVCSGYARLFQALAEAAGLEVKTVEGFSKGYNFTIGDKVGTISNHAWNVVKIDGQWRLIDSTWGAGYVNQDRAFIRSFDDHYFLTPPERFVYDHFPKDSAWQLLAQPLSSEAYEKMVLLKSNFFRYGLKIGSHPQARIEAGSELTVTFGAPENAMLMATLSKDGVLQDKSLTFMQTMEGKAELRVQFPQAGDYGLRVFVKRVDESGEYHEAADYRVYASQGAGEYAGFASTYSEFDRRKARLFDPMQAYLQADKDETFTLDVPDAEKVVVVVGSVWNELSKSGTRFSGNVRIDDDKVVVYAKFPGRSNYSGLVIYQVRH